MTTDEVMEAVEDIISKHTGDEGELLEALTNEASCWSMRLEEIDRDALEVAIKSGSEPQ